MIFVLKYILIFTFLVFATGCADETGTPPLTSNSFLACETDDIVKKVKSEPPILHECSAGSIRSADMLSLVNEGVSDEELLAVWSLDGYSGFTPAQLKVAGLTIAQMQAAGLSLWQIHIGGVSIAELHAASVSVSDLIRLGASVSELRTAGVSVSDLRTAGVNISDLRSAGVSVTDLRSAGVSLSELRSSGVSISDLLLSGASISELRTAGVGVSELLNSDVSVSELRAAGVTISDLRSHGVTIFELHSGGFTISQMQSAGLSILQMYTGGIRTADLQTASITLSQMRNAGISISEIHAGGVSLTDLLQEDDLSILNLHTKGIPRNVVFNEACNTASTSGTAPGPRITSVTTTETQVVLQAEATGFLGWSPSGTNDEVTFDDGDSVGDTGTLGNASARLLQTNPNMISTLSIPFEDVFSNPRFTVTDSQTRSTSINLCPGH